MSEETPVQSSAAPTGDSGTDWFDTGYENVIPPEASGGNKIQRFWMPNGTSKLVVFLSGEPLLFFEHSIYMDGNWRNFSTCTQKAGSCKLCDAQRNMKDSIQWYQAGVYTVIDTSKYTDRSGKERQNTKKLYVAKAKVMEKLKKRHDKALKENPLGLKGMAVTISRSKDPKSPNVGDDFELEDRIDLATLADSAEFNYREILKPDPEAVKRFIQRLGVSISARKEGVKGTNAVDYD